MARFVTGSEVVDVTATGTARDPAIADAGDIDTAAITLIHENGCITTIDNSRRALYGYDQRAEAFGSGGLVASENAAARAVVRRDASGAHEPPIADFFLDRYATSFVHQWEDFVGRIADRRPPSVTGLDGRAPLVLGLAARRSLDERRTVPVAELDPKGPKPDASGECRSGGEPIGEPTNHCGALFRLRSSRHEVVSQLRVDLSARVVSRTGGRCRAPRE
ncbi:MAG: hypothetical protein WKF58_06375 [Ilumatobacteraceae bacterium]